MIICYIDYISKWSIWYVGLNENIKFNRLAFLMRLIDHFKLKYNGLYSISIRQYCMRGVRIEIGELKLPLCAEDMIFWSLKT